MGIALEIQVSHSSVYDHKYALITFVKYSYSNLKISNNLLNTPNNYKDLGVLITENLKFKNHISLICFKASKIINILFRAFHTNSCSSSLMIINIC